MKIKRYQAREMRLALRQIRDELGANAVILSSRRLASGVEVTVAVDYEDVPSATAAGSAGLLTSARANVPAPGAHSVAPNAWRAFSHRALRWAFALPILCLRSSSR